MSPNKSSQENNQMSNAHYFSSQINHIKNNAIEASVSILGFKNSALRQHVINELSQQVGGNPHTYHKSQKPNGLIGNSVFEVLFPWEEQNKTIADFSGDLLHPKTVNAVAKDIVIPYKHQAKSWEILNDKAQTNSLVVTSGTGSGKTECFMVPILDDLVRLQQKDGGRLSGVHALFLYPLNALINSQRERLDQWTAPFGRDIQFCLYNGNTGESTKQESANEIISRDKLRESPPPILVTNATMLEYMLIRQKDAPIIEQSKGKLRWIVLDEAHSYVGSIAAELSLLLRRVMLAFDVEAKDVHFVATSATIGDDDQAIQKLQNYLAKLAGIDSSQIHVITGQRNVNKLMEHNNHSKPLSLRQIEKIEPDVAGSCERFSALEQHPFARKLRSCFVSTDNTGKLVTTANSLTELTVKLADSLELIENTNESINSDIENTLNTKQEYLLRWLDICSYTKKDNNKESIAFLPLRGHIFQRTLSGLYACVNPDCAGKASTPLIEKDKNHAPVWEFGYLYTSNRSHCEHCQFPVYELAFCQDCSTPHLLTQKKEIGVPSSPLIQFKKEQVDDFSLEGSDDELEDDSDNSSYVEDETGKKPSAHDPIVLMPVESSKKHLTASNDSEGETVYLVEECYLDELGVQRRRHQADYVSIAIKETNEDDNAALQHCYFCDSSSKYKNVIKTVNLGAPFYMSAAAPILLDHCAKHEDNPDSLPYYGRRMITFTDSRQGTARISMKLRQDSERRSLRHVVYHALAERFDPSLESSDEIEQKIFELTKEKSELDPVRFLRAIQSIDKDIAEQEQLLKQGQRPVIKWNDMLDIISKYSEFRFLAGSIHKIAYVNNIKTDVEKAELLLLNELARRPRNANSLETMGLVSVVYPNLQNATLRNVKIWEEYRLNLQDWQDFLKLILDFYIRESKFVNLTFDQLNCLSDKFLGKKELLAPNTKTELSDKDAKYIKTWTQVNNSNPNNSTRVIRLLCVATGLNPMLNGDRDKINTIMKSAWDELIRLGLLISNPANMGFSTYQFSFNEMAVTLPQQVWICPVTRRFLDTTFKGITPYIPHRQKLDTIRENIDKYCCQKVEIPVYKNEATDVLRKVQVEQWLAGVDKIQQLRKDNLWTDVTSSVIAGMNTIATEEHSAQINQKTLQRYEKQFKDGEINILNCSTTMEMGVDIGGITSVAMNNVPPHPANYLQRTGRAGRRNESQATAFTLCKNNPHEQMVFSNSKWAFETKISPPYIILNSKYIVQRHINAYLLGLFLNQKAMISSSAVLLKSGWFFFGWEDAKFNYIKDAIDSMTSTDSDESLLFKAKYFVSETPFRGLQQWLKEYILASDIDKEQLSKRVSAIVKDSTLSHTPINTLLENSMQNLQHLEKYFIDKVSSRINEYQTTVQNKKVKNQSYLNKLVMDIQGVANGYLLADLARHGFLPRYGFPSGLIEFDPYNSAAFSDDSKKKNKYTDREDNQSLRNGKPVRDIAIAIREYAPGNEVVVDGLVYKSAGLELIQYMNRSNSNDAQIIRSFWRCRNCGAMGESYDNQEHHCNSCEHLIEPENITRFVEPMGFRVDYLAKPHNKIDSQKFVPVEQPKIQANGDKLPLFSPVLGDYRVDEEGLIFHNSAGTHGNGYFICLHCGRAESVRYIKDSPAFTKQKTDFESFHTPMKPLSDFDLDTSQEVIKGICNRNGYQTQYLHIGAFDHTNVFELYLKNPETKQYFFGDEYKDLLHTMGAVLRNALAACQGITPDELGFGIKPVKMNNESSWSIFIYDKASGGAGFASAGPRYIHDMFKIAKELLVCPDDCDSVCQSCLLSYDTRFIVDSLNRHLAIEYLDSIENYLNLPEDAKLFSGAGFCNLTIEHRVVQALSDKFDQIVIYLQGDPKQWDLSTALTNKIKNWDYNGKQIQLVIADHVLAELDDINRIQLRFLSQFDNVSIHTWEANGSNDHPYQYLLQLNKSGTTNTLTLGTTDKQAYLPNDSFWQVSNDGIIVESESIELDNIITDPLDLTLLEKSNDNNAKLLTIGNELNGLLDDFGTTFWHILRESSEISGKLNAMLDVQSITYKDKYLRSPLTTILFGKVLYELKKTYGRDWPNPRIQIKTSHQVPENEPKYVWHNWLSSDVQEKVQERYFSHLGLDANVGIYDHRKLEHHRSLCITWTDKSQTVINLDHGLGFMDADTNQRLYNSFGFSSNIEQQVESMNVIDNSKQYEVSSKEGKKTLFTIINYNQK